MRTILVSVLLLTAAEPALSQTTAGAAPSDYELGVADDERGLYSQAVADFTRAIAHAQHARSYEGRGVAYEHLGRHDAAIADFTRAIALRPDFLDAYQSRGVAYDQKGLYDRAIADYTHAIDGAAGDEARKPGLAQTYFNRGAAFEHRRLYLKAAADYRAASMIDPAFSRRKTD